MTKTKAELEDEIKELKAELARADRRAELDKSAGEVKDMYDSFVRAGFSEGQAFEMLITLASKCM